MTTLPAHEPRCVDPADARAIDLVIEARPRDVGTIPTDDVEFVPWPEPKTELHRS